MDFSDLSPDAVLEAIGLFLPRLLLAVLIYIGARLLSRWVTRLIRRSLRRREVDEEVVILLGMLARWGILVIGIVLAIEQLAPGRLTALLAGVGVLGLTLGFALQDVARNFISGILLLITQPFEIGDTVTIQGFDGKVEAINLRMVEMRVVDGRYLMIPNQEVLGSSVINLTRSRFRRLEFELGVANDSDLDQVARVALEAIESNPDALDEPAPRIAFRRFGPFAIEGVLQYWVDTDRSDFLESHQRGVQAIQTAFDRAGIDMPYPISQVRLEQPAPGT